jgi:hypothetical protein
VANDFVSTSPIFFTVPSVPSPNFYVITSLKASQAKHNATDNVLCQIALAKLNTERPTSGVLLDCKPCRDQSITHQIYYRL